MPDRSVETRQRDTAWRRNYLAGNAFEFGVAVASVIAALVYFVNPHALEQTALGEQAGFLTPLWQVMFFAGGCLVVVGLWQGHAKIELYGLLPFATALVMNSLAVLIARGFVGAVAGLLGFGLFAGCVARLSLLVSAMKRASGS